MLKAIIEELNELKPCYNLESFNIHSAILNTSFFCVDIKEKETIGRFSHKTLFVYIYCPIEAYFILENLKKEVIKKLNKKRFSKKETNGNFWVEYTNETFSKIDKTIGKRCACLEFRIPVV